MNTRLTINNLYARVAMLLLVTVISLGAQAEEEQDEIDAFDLNNATINGINPMYIYTGDPLIIEYSVTDFEKREITYGVEYTATISDGASLDEENPKKIKISATGTYILTITAQGIDYKGTNQKKFKVVSFDSGKGTEFDPFVISKTSDLDLLSTTVYNGIDFNGKYFKVSKDITYENSTDPNYTPIGGWGIDPDNPMNFCGIFDGDGHTIKGIRVHVTGDYGFVGFFGRVGKNAIVKNLTLDNANITGPQYTGGIAGGNFGGMITNCHVTSTVTIDTEDNFSNSFHGGIVGSNESDKDMVKYGEVSYCTSAATLSAPAAKWSFYGGIAGKNASNCSLSHNLVIGATIPTNTTMTDKTYGAITGSNESDGNLDHNYYADCTGTNIGGCNNTDITIKDGAVPAIALYDTKDNATTISNNTGEHNVILAGRTLYKDGKWNTLCLPFNATKTGPLADATIKELDLTGSYSYTDGNHVTGFDSQTGTLYLNFKDATSVTAGTPYIIKWANGDNLVDPVFSSVNVTNAGLVDNIVSSDGYLKFKGTYSPKDIYTAEKKFLYLGSDNKLYYPSGENMTSFNVNACRAYFELLNGLTAGDPISGVRSFRLNFDGDPTGITTTNYTNFTNSEDTWYDLQGRRIANGKLSNGKLPKGLYIHNGRKVVIK